MVATKYIRLADGDEEGLIGFRDLQYRLSAGLPELLRGRPVYLKVCLSVQT